MSHSKTLWVAMAVAAAPFAPAYFRFYLTSQAGIFFQPLKFQTVDEINGLTQVANRLVNNAPPDYSESMYDTSFGAVHAQVKSMGNLAFAYYLSDLADTIHVSSTGGGPVTLRFDIPSEGIVTIDGTVVNAYMRSSLLIDDQARVNYENGYFTGKYRFTDSVPYEQTFNDGATFVLRHRVELMANPLGNATIDVDFLHTSLAQIQVMTPGASVWSDSGATYDPSAVPEPASLAALSLLCLPLARRRRSA